MYGNGSAEEMVGNKIGKFTPNISQNVLFPAPENEEIDHSAILENEEIDHSTIW